MTAGGRTLKQVMAACFAAAALAACATTPVAPPPPVFDDPEPTIIADPPPAIPAGPGPQSLPGWDQEHHLEAFEAWVVGCGAARDPAAVAVCARARSLSATRPSPSDARAFFEANFVVVAARTADGGPGLLTAYFAPEYPARHTQDAEFDAPVLGPPADQIGRAHV